MPTTFTRPEGRLGSYPALRHRTSEVNQMEKGEEEGKEGSAPDPGSRLLTEETIAANTPAVGAQGAAPQPPLPPQQLYCPSGTATASTTTPCKTKVCIIVSVIVGAIVFIAGVAGLWIWNTAPYDRHVHSDATPPTHTPWWRPADVPVGRAPDPDPAARVEPARTPAAPARRAQPASPFDRFVPAANPCQCGEAVKNNAWRALEQTWRQNPDRNLRSVETYLLRTTAKCYCDASQPKIEGRGQNYVYVGPSRGVSFRVNLPAGDVENLVQNNYIPVYHGTNPRAATKIIPSGQFLKPTDLPRAAVPAARPPVNLPFVRINDFTGEFEVVDRADVVFTSRSFLYALGYSAPRFGGGEVLVNGERYRIVIQALQREGTYRIGQETLENQVGDPNIDRREVEFYTSQPQFIRPYKVIVVKVRPGEP